MFDLGGYAFDEEAARGLAGLSIKACSEADIDETNAAFKERAKKRLREGHIMIGGFFQRQLAAYMWLSFQPIYWSDIDRFLELEGAYLWDAYTFPAFRRKRIIRHVYGYALGIAKNRTTRVYGLAETNNYPSCRSLDAIGWSRVKIACYLRFFKWKRYAEHDDAGFGTFT